MRHIRVYAPAARGAYAAARFLYLLVWLIPLIPCAAAQDEDSRAATIQREREEKARNLKPEEPAGIEKKLLILKERQILQRFGQNIGGLFPKVGGVATGQGFGLGLQYRRDFGSERNIQFFTSGIGTVADAWRYDLGVSAPALADGRLGLDFIASHRDLTRVDFYGLGPDSELSDRTSFKLEDTSFDGTLTLRPFRKGLQFGLTGGSLAVNTGSGNRPGIPSTEEMFAAATLPGLADQTAFWRYGGFAALDFRDNPSLAREGGLLSAAFTYYDDRDLGRHDFRKVELEAQQYIGFFNKRRVIALRARTELNYTNGDQSVPFYLKPWIGGPGELRGFRNYRFYDDNVLILNAEYRWEAFSGLDMALFLDAGQVAARREDFALDQMETAAGFGFRFNVRNATILRLDVAFSHEGTRIWFRFGSPF